MLTRSYVLSLCLYQISVAQRMLILPPELAYGDKGVQEIPPNATIEVPSWTLSAMICDDGEIS